VGKDFIEECVQFPNGAHDDQVDAMTQALLRWHEVPKQQTYVSYCHPVPRLKMSSNPTT
jgi:hypothetical protein